jgi:IS1 family transposase
MLDTQAQECQFNGMNKLDPAKRAQALQMMAEGISLRSMTRLTGISRTTLIKLLEDAGQAFSEYMDKTLVNLPCKRLQVDEAWAFSYCKQKNLATAKAAPAGAGDIWTWVALDADTKLVASFYVGNRDGEAALDFMTDLAPRLANRVQLTSDGRKAYLNAVEEAFGADVDYAQLVKIYGQPTEGVRRYSPPECIGAQKHAVNGKPDRKHVSTSYVERQNLNIRMGNRRMTRLTNAFSKKAANHAHMMAIYFMHYNFVRIHQTLKITPAMAAGVTSKLWEMADMVTVLEAWESETGQ